MRWRAVISVGLCWLALAATAPVAHAFLYSGGTSQAQPVSLRSGTANTVARMQIQWIARCRQPRTTLQTGTTFTFGRATTRSFHVTGSYRFRQSPYSFRVDLRLSGRRSSAVAWQGRFVASAAVSRNGRPVDRCVTPSVAWRASAHQATLRMRSDPQDYIGQGRDYSYVAPPDLVQVTGSVGAITVNMGGWSLQFNAAQHRRLQRGHYLFTRRSAGAQPGLAIYGQGRGCDQISGEFNVTAVAFDRNQHIVRLELTFVQHCEGGPSALRGSFSYRA